MASNIYINAFSANNEQDLIEDLVVESIKFYAHDVYYLPRTNNNIDPILHEPEYYSFDSNLPIEIYFKSFDAFEGDGQLLSKFGVEVRDQLTLVMSIRSFNEFIAPNVSYTRPNEGDIIYLPMIGAAYQIKFVENAVPFYQMGSLQSYELICEVFEYSNEVFATGISEIDDKYNAFSTDSLSDVLENEIGLTLMTEKGYPLIIESYDANPSDIFGENDELQNDADDLLDWTERDPFSETGTF